MRKLLSLFAAIFMAVSMWGTTVTFTFKTDNDITYTATGNSGGGAAATVSKSNVTLSGTNAYTTSGKSLNVYAGATLTVSVPAGNQITSITATYASSCRPFVEAMPNGVTDYTAKLSGASSGSWNGTASQSVTLTNGASGKTELTVLVVNYETSGGSGDGGDGGDTGEGGDSGDGGDGEDPTPSGNTTTWELVTSISTPSAMAGQYIIVAKPSNGTRVLLNGAQNSFSSITPLTLASTDFSEDGNELTITTDVDPSFTITPILNGGQFNIKGSSGTWLGGSTGGASLTNNQSNWVFEPKANGKMWIRVYAASMSRAILYRSTPTFQHYATSNETSNGYGSVYLYRKVVDKVTVSAAQYATYYNASSAYVMPEGLEGITVEGVEGSDLTLIKTHYAAGTVVPAGEALILHGAAGNYTLLAGSTANAKVAQNLLKGTSTADQFTTGGDKYYRLSVHGGVVGFYYGAADGAAFKPGANKAYLAVSDAAAPAHFTFADEVTAVENVEATETVKFMENGQLFIKKNGVIYNAMGQVVK